MRWWQQFASYVLSLLILLGPVAAFASISDPRQSSTSYSIVESEVGGAANFNQSSTNYSVNPNIDDGGSTLGDLATGNSASANYQTNSGFNTTAQPSLTFVVNTSTVDLGVLTTAAKSTATATFNVKDYTSYGYTVTIVGAPPVYGGHQLTALTTDTASAAGTEQFGVNTVFNTSAGVGADPVQVPDSTFSFGVAGDGSTGVFGTSRPYTIPDKWRFNSGETIASASKSSGETDYTMTFMANISNLTPGGKYSGVITLLATGTY